MDKTRRYVLSIRWHPVPETRPEFPWTAPWGEEVADPEKFAVAIWERDAQVARYFHLGWLWMNNGDLAVRRITHIAPLEDLLRMGPKDE